MKRISGRIGGTRRRTVLLAALAAMGIGAALADEAIVNVQKVVIRSGKGSMHAPVGQAVKDQKLQVVAREADGWLKVQIDGKEGYVRATALEPKTAPLSGQSLGLTSGTSGVGESLAGRGVTEIDDGAIRYASSNNLSTDGLERMFASRDRVTGQPWVQFTNEGKVGPAKQ